MLKPFSSLACPDDKSYGSLVPRQSPNQQIEKPGGIYINSDLCIRHIFVAQDWRVPGAYESGCRSTNRHSCRRILLRLRLPFQITGHRTISQRLPGRQLTSGFHIDVVLLPFQNRRIEKRSDRKRVVHVWADKESALSIVVDGIAANLRGRLTHRILSTFEQAHVFISK